MADIPPGIWEEGFKWLCGIAAGVTAWLFKDVHARINDAKKDALTAAAAALEVHKTEMNKALEMIRGDISHHRDIEAKLFDELSAAERTNAQRYAELSQKMSESHLTLNNQIHSSQREIISHIDRVLSSKDRN